MNCFSLLKCSLPRTAPEISRYLRGKLDILFEIFTFGNHTAASIGKRSLRFVAMESITFL